MLDEKIFRKKLEAALEYTNPILSLVYGLPTYTVDQICETYLPYGRSSFVLTLLSSSLFLNEELEAGQEHSL